MTKTFKKLDINAFATMQKEVISFAEFIKAKQDEKQTLMNDFESESKRFFFGKISETALMSSVKKTNKELNELDREITKAINGAKKVLEKKQKIITAQKPVLFNATLSGIKDKPKQKKKTKKKSKK